MRAICGVQLQDRKLAKDQMLIFGLNEVEDQRNEWRLKRIWNNQVDEESMKAVLISLDVLCCSKWIV